MARDILFSFRLWAKRHLSDNLISALRRPFRYFKSRKRTAARRQSAPLTLERLTADLVNGGVKPGDHLMIHASLSQIGNVDGGAQTVIQSLINVVTPEGTIIMPCYNSAESYLKDLKVGSLLDLRASPSLTGKITETFRVWPGVLRSSHPFSSACAWGKSAEYVTSGHAADPHVCHAGSPVGRLVELKGQVLGIGIRIAEGLGVAHYLEDTWAGFPFEVHTSNFKATYIDCNGNRIEREICRFDPGVAKTRIDYPEGAWICEKFTDHFTRKGIMKWFRYGECDSWLMDAVELYDELKRLAAKGVTMYLTEDKLTDRNRDIENW
jgi:aminoglycoside 3-N-acetyltransferase